MSLWKDKADFMKDIEGISEFYIEGYHNNPGNKFVVKSRKEQKPVYTPWYESESDEEVDYSLGRGKKSGNTLKSPGATPNHLDVMKEIQMQVRSAVGNRYNNEALECYYNVCKDDVPNPAVDTPSCAPKEVSISYAREQNLLKNSTDPLSNKKNTIAENIENASCKLTEDIRKSSPALSASSSPKKENVYQVGSLKKRYDAPTNKSNPTDRFPFSLVKQDYVNLNSRVEFPPL